MFRRQTGIVWTKGSNGIEGRIYESRVALGRTFLRDAIVVSFLLWVLLVLAPTWRWQAVLAALVAGFAIDGGLRIVCLYRPRLLVTWTKAGFQIRGAAPIPWTDVSGVEIFRRAEHYRHGTRAVVYAFFHHPAGAVRELGTWLLRRFGWEPRNRCLRPTFANRQAAATFSADSVLDERRISTRLEDVVEAMRGTHQVSIQYGAGTHPPRAQAA
jgi:hypothetical protein